MNFASDKYQFSIDFSSVKSVPEDPKVRLEYFQRFKALIAAKREQIKAWHRAGAGGREVIQAHTALMDQTIKHVVVSLALLPEHRPNSNLKKFALVAVGGYGRGELNPGSDIDLLFLLRKKMDAALDHFIRDIISVLWGLDMEIGQSCRTIRECRALAQNDPTVKTSMVETRFLLGTHELYRKLWDSVRKNVLKKKAKQFLNTELKEIHLRPGSAEGVTSHPEPDIKDGPGGLRDYHLALWAVAISFNGLSFREIGRDDVINSEELDSLEESVDFLLRVRNELHYLKGKKSDILELSLQAELAGHLGYQDTPERSRQEQFMRNYYQHATTIRHISEALFQRCLGTKPLIKKMLSTFQRKKLGNGFVAHKTTLSLLKEAEASLAEDPALILTALDFCRDHQLIPDAQLKRLIRQHLPRLDADFIRGERARDFLLGILDHPEAERTLRLMHELGVLSHLLPEFSRALFQVHYNFYHRYTSDEHALRMVGFLEKIPSLATRGMESFVAAYENVQDKVILKLACLLHSLGKEPDEPLPEKTWETLAPVCERLQLSLDQKTILHFLIHHLNTLNETAFHQDTHQPSTLKQIAEQVEFPERLDLLLLNSYADLKAMAPDTWTAWKKTLLTELYHRTRSLLVRPESLAEKPQATRQAVYAVLRDEFPREQITDHLDAMPDDYFQTADSKDVAEHIRLIQCLPGQPFVLRITYNESGGVFNLILCCPNNIDVFKNLVGALTAKALNILGAQIFTRGDQTAIITLQVEGAEAIKIHGTGNQLWEDIESNLQKVLAKQETLSSLLKRRTRIQSASRSTAAIIPKISIENNTGNPFTAVRIEAKDHPGMLYKIVHCFAGFGIQIHRAKISNQGGRGVDVFSVSLRGEKLQFQRLIQRLKENIITTLLVDNLEDLV